MPVSLWKMEEEGTKRAEIIGKDDKQHLLKEQFSHVQGLQSTLLQAKKIVLHEEMIQNKLHIVHCTQLDSYYNHRLWKESKGI